MDKNKTMTEQELKLELLKVAKAQNPHEMGSSPLDVAETYYQWVKGNVTFEEENMIPPGYKDTLRIRHQVQSIIKTAQSELFEIRLQRDDYTTFLQKEVQICTNAFNKLLEL